jgi:hypothetical protein
MGTTLIFVGQVEVDGGRKRFFLIGLVRAVKDIREIAPP